MRLGIEPEGAHTAPIPSSIDGLRDWMLFRAPSPPLNKAATVVTSVLQVRKLRQEKDK